MCRSSAPPGQPPSALFLGITRSPLVPTHPSLFPCAHQYCHMQEGTRYSRMDPGLMIQPEDVAQAALLAFRLGPTADPVELVLNRLQTPYQE